MRIGVVGLGYVGLPLAVAFSRHFDVVGYDVRKEVVESLEKGIDKTGEIESRELLKSKIKCSSDASVISDCDVVIIAVPTPVTKAKKPDLHHVEDACRTVGKHIKKGAIVVLESTVYPGVTEEICAPILEKESRMKCGIGFKVGYSPERVNPGDKEHTIESVVKIVSGMDSETTEKLSTLYGTIVKAGIHKAANIRTAEAAKVIENVQRDLNIALANELSIIFAKMGINTSEVLAAAGTKWNFHKYHPGLVGGHCIGVDPYYLTYKALELGYHPRVILAGREVNDYMPRYVGELVIKALNNAGKVLKDCKVLVMGLTFKENVPDVRNSKARDLIHFLKEYNVHVAGCDPMLSEGTVNNEFEVENLVFERINGKFDCAVVVSPHRHFKDVGLEQIRNIMKENPVLVDLKGFYDREEALEKGFAYIRL